MFENEKWDSGDWADIFEPFEKLVTIEIAGARRAVPENNTLLRGLQFLSMNTISLGNFCWNGDCANCQVWVEENGREKIALACRVKVSEGMKITRMNGEIVDSGDW